MGLDMTLYTSVKDGDRYIAGDETAYWRKVYFINDWIYNLQNQVGTRDDFNLAQIELTGGNLQKLKETCKKVLKDITKADKLLPSSCSKYHDADKNEYNSTYMWELEYTVERLDDIDYKMSDVFIYEAWW